MPIRSHGFGLGKLQLIEKETIAGAAVDEVEYDVDLDSLDYLLLANIYNPLGAGCDYLMEIATDTTANKYYRETLIGNNGPSGSRANDNVLANAAAGSYTCNWVHITQDAGKYVRWLCLGNSQAPASIQMLNIWGIYNDTSGGVTKLGVTAGSAGGIGIGSSFKLFKYGV